MKYPGSTNQNDTLVWAMRGAFEPLTEYEEYSFDINGSMVQKIHDIFANGYDSIILFTDKIDHDYFQVYKQVAEKMGDEIFFTYVDVIEDERANASIQGYFGAT